MCIDAVQMCVLHNILILYISLVCIVYIDTVNTVCMYIYSIIKLCMQYICMYSINSYMY